MGTLQTGDKMSGTNLIKGRLTSGNAPLHERRTHLSNAMRDGVQTIRIMLTNWPAEYALPVDHPVHEWLEVTDYICDQLEQPVCPNNANAKEATHP